MGAAKIFQTVAQKSLTNEPLISVASLKKGKESFNFLELELSKKYYLAMEKFLENIGEYICVCYIYGKYVYNVGLSGKTFYNIVSKV